MEDSKNKSLHALRNSGAEKIFEAYKWVNEHRHEFNKDVYGPVLIEVHNLYKLLFGMIIPVPLSCFFFPSVFYLLVQKRSPE